MKNTTQFNEQEVDPTDQPFDYSARDPEVPIEDGPSGHNTPYGFILRLINPDGRKELIIASFAEGVSIERRPGEIDIEPDNGTLIRHVIPKNATPVLERLPPPRFI